jgi:O-phosphoseryl-tRNA(Cys) synthetase
MWDYRAALVEVHDGDTIVALIDQGLSGRQEEALRLLDVWAPELADPGGAETTEFVRGWFASVEARRRWPLEVWTVPTTRKVEPTERRTLTRYEAIVLNIATRASLNEAVRGFLAGHPEWGGGTGST